VVKNKLQKPFVICKLLRNFVVLKRQGSNFCTDHYWSNLPYLPDEMRIYLLDYKEGVEFQMDETHPNVELLLLDNSNFSIGVNALKQFRNEINKRSKLFKELSPTIASINKYNNDA